MGSGETQGGRPAVAMESQARARMQRHEAVERPPHVPREVPRAPEGPGVSPRAAPPPAGQDPDVGLAVSGDAAAFERLVLRYQDDVVTTAHYLLGNYEDAVDAAQETFLKAFRGLGGFRAQAAFRTWLLTIATNCARSLRSRKRAKKRSARIVSLSGGDLDGSRDPGREIDVPDREPSRSPTGLLARKEVKEALENAIAELDGTSRQVIVLRDIAGESYEAIAAALDLPLGTVKSRVHRARLEIQSRMRPFLEA